MQKTVLSVLHNIKDYQYYDNSAMPLQKDDADILIAFLEQEDVQKCIPKVVRFGACPCCGKQIEFVVDKCETCGQKLRWVENNEKTNKGSSIFSNFDIDVDNLL